MLSCGAAFSLREANVTEMKTTFTPYDSDDVLTATVNGSGDESKITLSAQDSSNTGARIMRFVTDLAARRRGAKAGAVIGGERTMWDMSEHVEHGFGPVWDSESRILILGSMPSPKSRKAAFYYMHPQNRFWPVMQALFADPADPSDVTGDSLQSRRAFALRHHIALWDVIESCDINRGQRRQHPQRHAERSDAPAARCADRSHIHHRSEVSATLSQTHRTTTGCNRHHHRHDSAPLHQSGQRLDAAAGAYRSLPTGLPERRRS